MGKIVEKKKKKKGRPSLLDLQKRNLKEQQELQQQRQKRQLKKFHNTTKNDFASHSRDNYNSAIPVRRSARRNPNPYDDDDDDGDLAGKRREKKLKLVLRLPLGQDNPEASFDSAGEDSNAGENSTAGTGNKKRKINAISDGSGIKGDKSVSGSNQSNAFQGVAKLDSGPSTPLPDKKLLVFILDRLQKKDTYGVFSEPVDHEELPDYHEVIEHPMDFGTVRKKLSGGAYANLEDFEKDVFLICSNAMQYNAPETVYFRQARSILELAKKNFENLRQDSDDNEPEPKVVVRRGRPPTKNLKKTIGRPSLEALGSEFFSDVALATGAENAMFPNHDLRKGSHLLDKSGLADSSGRLLGLRSSNDLYSSWLADNKLERNDEFTGSLMRNNMKHVKKQVVHDESRRNTYIQPHPSASLHEPSVLKTFDAERKQLMPVGVLVEHGYARSLAQFAANLGPLAWKVAAKKIERSLPSGTKFGPGWVGENDLPQRKMPLFPLPSHSVGQPSVSHHSPDPPNSLHIPSSCDVVESKVEVSSGMPEGENGSGNHVSSSSASASEMPLATTGSSSSPLFTSKCRPESIIPKPEPAEGSNPHSGFPVLNSNIAGIRPRSPFPTLQGPVTNPGMNGFNGFNLGAQVGKLSRPGFNIPHSKTNSSSSNNNNYNKVHSETVNILRSEDTDNVLENRRTISAGTSLSNQGNEAPVQPSPGCHPQPSWPQQNHKEGLSQPQQKPESVPPDLNIRFQSPGSPSSSRVDSTQPDLALQL